MRQRASTARVASGCGDGDNEARYLVSRPSGCRGGQVGCGRGAIISELLQMMPLNGKPLTRAPHPHPPLSQPSLTPRPPALVSFPMHAGEWGGNARLQERWAAARENPQRGMALLAARRISRTKRMAALHNSPTQPRAHSITATSPPAALPPRLDAHSFAGLAPLPSTLLPSMHPPPHSLLPNFLYNSPSQYPPFLYFLMPANPPILLSDDDGGGEGGSGDGNGCGDAGSISRTRVAARVLNISTSGGKATSPSPSPAAAFVPPPGKNMK